MWIEWEDLSWGLYPNSAQGRGSWGKEIFSEAEQ